LQDSGGFPVTESERIVWLHLQEELFIEKCQIPLHLGKDHEILLEDTGNLFQIVSIESIDGNPCRFKVREE
jgi:hypothetical protein